MSTKSITPKRFTFTFSNTPGLNAVVKSLEKRLKGLNRADIIIAIQDKEKNFFSTLTTKKVITVGHNVIVKKLDKKKDSQKIILFIGSENSINKNAINNFLTHIFPIVKNLL